MKRYLQSLFAIVAAIVVLAGCKKDEYKVYYEGGTAPVLSANKANALALSFANANSEAVTLKWTNPNYKFTTGISSQNVTYKIEIDTVGANFNSRIKRVVSVSNDLSKSFTQSDINDIMLNGMELTAGRQYNLEMRVVASLSNYSTANAVPLASNALRFSATPYVIPPKVQPYTGEVFIIGDATQDGWGNPVTTKQKMTQVTPLLYEITTQLNGGKSLLFLPENGSWARKYGFTGAKNENNPNGDEFKQEGNDIKVPAENGTYKIELNFQTGKFKFTKQ